MKKEVNNVRRKRKLNFQKIFNLVSATFILACCIFYGTRFIKLYIENNKVEKITVLADNIKENNKENNNFKQINEDYYFTNEDENNYIKYSNILWRIIKINSDKTITLVSNNSLTALAPGNEKEYEKTYLNIWLNKTEKDNSGILQTNLNNIEKYLTFTKTCKDIVTNTKNITCKDKIEDTYITIPSIYDYINTGGNKGFMNNEEYFYLTNMNNENKLMYIDSTGKTNYTDENDILGIKPVITIKNTITLKEGNGTKDNPYTFEEEQGLLGSYIKLGDDIWRIYSIEDNIVKLSLNNYLKINNTEVKYKYSNNGYYHNDTKQGSLAYYLNNTYLNSLNYKDKIKETKFANGIYSNTTNYDYSKVLTTNVDTKISVLSIGNIFLNNQNTNYFLSTGISKDSSLVYVMQDDYKVYTKVSTTNLRIIPTTSIEKSLLTKGNGTENNPYEVE